MDPLEIIWKWLQSNYGKLVFLAIVVLIAIIIDKALTRVVRKILDRSQVPNASIFVNILRVVVWVLAVATVLQPVFGVNPTTLFTALGIGGLAVSLGLKDTIANVIGGFGLMLGHVIQPGDYVSVSGTKGVVKDINWRQTIVRERNGNEMVIPNSILNTASLEKLDPINECLVQVPFTAKAGIDPDQMEQDIIAAVEKETKGLANTQYPTKVKLTGFSPYGIEGMVYAFAKSDLLLSTMADAVARAIANAEYLSMAPSPQTSSNAPLAQAHTFQSSIHTMEAMSVNAVNATVSMMNATMPELPSAVPTRVPRGSSSGAV